MRSIPMTRTPCPRCSELAREGRIRAETVQPLPEGAFAPMGLDGRKCCLDCQAADNLIKFRLVPAPEDRDDATPFRMARVAVGNDRQEQYRLPGMPMGLVKDGYVRPSAPGDFEKHLAWLDEHDWFGQQEDHGWHGVG